MKDSTQQRARVSVSRRPHERGSKSQLNVEKFGRAAVPACFPASQLASEATFAISGIRLRSVNFFFGQAAQRAPQKATRLFFYPQSHCLLPSTRSPCTCTSGARACSSPCRSPCTGSSGARARTASVVPFSRPSWPPCTHCCKNRSSSCFWAYACNCAWWLGPVKHWCNWSCHEASVPVLVLLVLVHCTCRRDATSSLPNDCRRRDAPRDESIRVSRLQV
jgi:hypothetical protein